MGFTELLPRKLGIGFIRTKSKPKRMIQFHLLQQCMNNGINILIAGAIGAVLCLALWYGVVRSLDNRCDYYMNELTPTEKIKEIC